MKLPDMKGYLPNIFLMTDNQKRQLERLKQRISTKSPQKQKTEFLRKKDLPNRSETHVYCLNKQGFFKIDPPRMRTTGLILCTGCGQPIYSHTHEDAYESN